MTEPASSQGRSSAANQERIWDAKEDDAAAALPPASPEGSHPAEATAAAGPALADPGAAGGRSGRPGASWARSLTSATRVPGPAGLTIADVPDRVIAFILDAIVLSIVGLLLALVIGGAFGGLASGAQTAGGSMDAAGGALNVGAFLVVAMAELALSFAYFAWSWVVLRGTPGMKMLGLQIGDQADGHSISWDQALVRWLLLGIAATLATFAVYVPSLVGLVVAIIALLWLTLLLYTTVLSPTKQGLHDRTARTVLVKSSRRPGRV
jgi:uncharacterized RDD family membrane protein YckC